MAKRNVDEDRSKSFLDAAIRRVALEQRSFEGVNKKLRAARDDKASPSGNADLCEYLDLIAQAYRRNARVIAAASKALARTAVPTPELSSKPVEAASKATP